MQLNKTARTFAGGYFHPVPDTAGLVHEVEGAVSWNTESQVESWTVCGAIWGKFCTETVTTESQLKLFFSMKLAVSPPNIH